MDSAHFDARVRFSDQGTTVPENRIILQDENFILTPCKGAIVPGWLLAWSSSRALNFSGQLDGYGQIQIFANRIVERAFGNRVNFLWFEHGASETGSKTGCGIDWAHLHLLIAPPFSLAEFRAQAEVLAGENWNAAQHAPASVNHSYHVFGSKTDHFSMDDTGRLGSQFFRRVVAKIVGCESSWDYKTHSFEENIVTAENVSILRKQFLEEPSQ